MQVQSSGRVHRHAFEKLANDFISSLDGFVADCELGITHFEVFARYTGYLIFARPDEKHGGVIGVFRDGIQPQGEVFKHARSGAVGLAIGGILNCY